MNADPSARKEPLVLLVEDREDTYELYSELLASAGYAVIGADTGEDAVESAHRLKPDLIVMDVDLRGMNGCDATRLLKADPHTEHIPILVLSGYTDSRTLQIARRSGCDAFLAKPCPLDRLLEEIARHVAPRAGGSKILIVEDDDEIRESLAAVLVEDGHPVATARNGAEALELLRGSSLPGLILLDLMMPVMDGWKFREAQRQDPQLASIPVVILSAVANLQQSAATLDVSECLAKPVELPVLLDAVHRYA